eukprot:m.174580 g.174580  ORF g.174580 m.174580 type:complete len:107 (-) comp16540_c0_seq1:3327-3647(-)
MQCFSFCRYWQRPGKQKSLKPTKPGTRLLSLSQDTALCAKNNLKSQPFVVVAESLRIVVEIVRSSTGKPTKAPARDATSLGNKAQVFTTKHMSTQTMFQHFVLVTP